jgi:ribosomal protein L29
MASLAKTKMEQKINKIKNVRQQAELRNKIAVLKTIMGQKS